MKKSLSMFLASIFAINSFAIAGDYPCKAEYENELAELNEDYLATLSRTFKKKIKVVGGTSLDEQEFFTLAIPGNDAELHAGNGVIAVGNIVGAPVPGAATGGLVGAGIGAATSGVPKVWPAMVAGGIPGTVVGTLVMANVFLLDANWDFKEITHFGSTMRFFKYVQLQAANDVLKEIYHGREVLNAQYRQRSINMQGLNDASDKRLAKINQRRGEQNLPPLKMEETFADFKVEEIEDVKINSALDAVIERVQNKLGATFSKDELVKIIRHINEEKTFCEDGEPVKLKQMYKIIKGRIS